MSFLSWIDLLVKETNLHWFNFFQRQPADNPLFFPDKSFAGNPAEVGNLAEVRQEVLMSFVKADMTSNHSRYDVNTHMLRFC